MHFVVLGAAIAAVLLVELGLRRIGRLPDPYALAKRVQRISDPYVPLAHPPWFEAEIVGGHPMVSPHGRFVTNSLGMRSPEVARVKPDGTFRVVLLGASSMECRYVDEPRTVRALLEEMLAAQTGRRVEVIFGGGWGARTYDYIAVFAHRLAHLQPDLVIAAPGLADLYGSALGHEYLAPPPLLRPGSRRARQLAMMLATELQLGRLLLRAARRGDGARPQMCVPDLKHWWYRGEPGPGQHHRLVPDIVGYTENLRSLAGLAAGHGLPLILCTQPTLFETALPGLGPDSWYWIGDRAFRRAEVAAAMNAYNEATRAVAQSAAAGMCDLAKRFDGARELYFDDSHFGIAGAEIIARALAEFVQRGMRRDDYSSPKPATMYSATQR